MTTTLGYAVLGLLARAPLTGYDLARELRTPVGLFWTARHSQIYPELARLTEAGLVTYEVIDGPGPRDTKRYAITAPGRAELGRWLTQPAPSERPRDQFMLKMWSIWVMGRDAAVRLVEGQRERHATRLAEYRSIEQEQLGRFGDRLADPSDPVFASYAVLRRGIDYEQMAYDWCEWLLGRLSQPT